MHSVGGVPMGQVANNITITQPEHNKVNIQHQIQTLKQQAQAHAAKNGIGYLDPAQFQDAMNYQKSRVGTSIDQQKKPVPKLVSQHAFMQQNLKNITVTGA